MKLTLTLEDVKWGYALTKEAGDSIQAEANVLAKVNEYLDACARDVGADDLANVTKELADPAKLSLAKAALGL